MTRSSTCRTAAARDGLTSPIATFQPQGRDTRNYQFIDTATYVTGDHTLQFGGSYQRIKVNPYNYASRFPTITFGFSAAAPAAVQLSAAQFPGGISAADLATANAHLAYLAGIVSQVAQTFQVQRRKTSGFVAGIPDEPQLDLQQLATSTSRTTGARDPASPSGAASSGSTSARCARTTTCSCCRCRTAGQSTADALLNPAGTVDFVNGGMYSADRNNFGPTDRLRLGSVQERPDRGARRLHAGLRQRGDDHRRAQRRDRQLGPRPRRRC